MPELPDIGYLPQRQAFRGAILQVIEIRLDFYSSFVDPGASNL